MKHLIVFCLLSMFAILAYADGPTPEPPKKDRQFEVLFACSFNHRHHEKKIHCLAQGEVSVKAKGDVTALAGDDSDERRLRVVCTDGFYDDDHAVTRLKDEGRHEKDDLIISDKEKGGRDILTIRDISLKHNMEGRNKDDDQDLDARLTLEDGTELCGYCDVCVDEQKDRKPLFY